MAMTSGYGGYPNDCCQKCGKYLEDVCYSKQQAEKRVPRTNKICASCFEQLPDFLRQAYFTYSYRRGHEPSSVGWDPHDGWGRKKRAQPDEL